MSNRINDEKENILQNNEEACILREIFNIIEAKKENKEIDNKKNVLIEKYKIKNLKLENIHDVNKHPKNKFKTILQKLILKKTF